MSEEQIPDLVANILDLIWQHKGESFFLLCCSQFHLFLLLSLLLHTPVESFEVKFLTVAFFFFLGFDSVDAISIVDETIISYLTMVLAIDLILQVQKLKLTIF